MTQTLLESLSFQSVCNANSSEMYFKQKQNRMQTIKSENVPWANKDLDHQLQVLFHHLEYLEDQMDIVKTVNLYMSNDIPHEDLLECLRKKINVPINHQADDP